MNKHSTKKYTETRLYSEIGSVTIIITIVCRISVREFIHVMQPIILKDIVSESDCLFVTNLTLSVMFTYKICLKAPGVEYYRCKS